MSENHAPDPKSKFTFGLWTVGNVGRDPFGGPVREPITPAQIADLLGEVGAYGVNFHDNDLIPIDATPGEASQIKKDFKKALRDNGLVVPMATTNLFSDPVFKDGAFTSNNAKIRAYAVQKTMRAMELGKTPEIIGVWWVHGVFLLALLLVYRVQLVLAWRARSEMAQLVANK